MSILNIKERFSQRIQQSERDRNENSPNSNGSEQLAVNAVFVNLREPEVGITEYVSDLPGFRAVIKQRFSDFNVHEIDEEGNVAILNNFDVPTEVLQYESDSFDLLSADVMENIVKLVDKSEGVDSVDIDVTKNTKDERKSIHQFIKGKYGTQLISNTFDDGDNKVIKVSRAADCGKDSRRPSHLHKFVHFIMSKSNIDSNEALSILGTKMKMKISNFNIAGTKDKRANTSQWISVKNAYASKLMKLNATLRRIRLGNFSYKEYGLSMGSLKGNNFQIALRNLTASDDVVNFAMNKLKENGFINYFGLQRFGNCAECPTHEVGKFILKEAYGRAIELLLKPRSSMEQPDMRQAREIWSRTRNASQALTVLRHKDRTIEAQILTALKKHGPNAFVNALDSLPRNVCLMYLHAYQSLIWNKVVSRRIVKYGLKVLVGDLVLMKTSSDKNCLILEDAISSDDTQENSDATVEKQCPVRPITEDELDSHCIYDVLLPIPGNETSYPKNEIADWYSEFLAEDGLTSEAWDARIRKYALPGSYRKMMGKLGNMSWRFANYSSPDDDLILGDIDILDGKTIPDCVDGPHRALVMNFDLDRSAYATMVIREALRIDTSTATQVEMNNTSVKRPGSSRETSPSKRPKIEDCHDDDGVDGEQGDNLSTTD